MANSKSNIYPIQLQGAELNLNKYDAEIKQYSGFNKNNSPFVGGCLSNIFTKEEQIEGGNADNVFINTNGDVYRVDNEGLYQNGTQIIKYPSTVKFYEKEKVNFNKDVVYAISDKIYITIEEDLDFPASFYEGFTEAYKMAGYVAHWGNGHSAVLCSVKSTKQAFIDIETKNGKIVFSVKRYVDLNGTNTSCLHIVYVPAENASQSYKYGPERSGPIGVGCRLMAQPDIKGPYDFDYVSQAVYFDENYFLISQNGLTMSYVFQFMYDNPDGFTYSDRFTETDGQNYLSIYYNSYYMCNNGVFYFYRVGKVSTAITNTYTFDISSNYKNYVDSFFLGTISGVLTAIKVTAQIRLGQSSNGKTIKTSRVYGIFKPWGCSYNSFTPFEGDSETKGLNISFCNNFKNLAIHNDNGIYKNVTGAVILKNGFKILISDNQVVNISILDMWHSPVHGKFIWLPKNNFNGVIIEQWNMIEYFYIYDDCIFYKLIDGGFYIVKESTPKIGLKNNQLIVNCNYEKNSYDLSDNVIKHFGSDWICEYLISNMPDVGNVGSNYNFNSQFVMDKDLPNSYWIASSVNEYNQKNNPSLLLNMKSVINDFWIIFIGVPYGSFAGDNTMSFAIADYLSNGAVNIYVSDYNGSMAYYLGSGDIGKLRNENLVGLPFPNNTEGNVQYNPSLFSEFITNFSNNAFVKEDTNVYQLAKSGQENIMAYFLGTLVEGLDLVFILQGQYYGIINNMIFALTFVNGVISDTNFVVNIQGLQFCGNTPYEALFYSKTNRCLYSFTGVNVLASKQLVDKIGEVKNYLYNPATQTVFLITDVGVFFYGIFGQFLLEDTNVSKMFLLNDGIVLNYNNGNYKYIKYYLDSNVTGYTKERIKLETCFYGMNDQTVTINDCLYFRLFSEEHEAGELKVSATTLSLEGRKTEETTFKIKSSDWDKLTHTIYLRYQPKEQRGLGVSFLIDSPFKIAAMSVGSQADSILVDKVSKGAINAPQQTSNNTEW